MTLRVRIKVAIEGLCPCGVQFRAGETVPEGVPCVVHDPPVCPQYDSLQPHEYLAWVRHRQENPND